MRRSGIRLVVGLTVLLGVLAVAFVAWAKTAYPPGPRALAALVSDSVVQVVERDAFVAFEPTASPAPAALVFYPGARVDFRAYAPILRRVAAQGYLVVVVRVRLNLALLDVDAAAPVLHAYPQIGCWAVGGHSLGGVASAQFAARQPQVKGIVFWASYPADDRLKNAGLKMLSIYGSEDGLLDDGAKIERYKAYQPPDTRFVVLEGGNHSQFGDYGFQPGDHPATISAERQWEQTAEVTGQLLEACAP